MTQSLPPIGFGTYELDSSTCYDAVRHAVSVGYRHIDTAEMYENETAVGRAISDAEVDRDELVIATKLHSTNLAFDAVIEQAGVSRDRLGVSTIDLLYVHWPIRTYEPTETLPAFEALYSEGIIDGIGLSNFTPALLAEAIEQLSVPIVAHQVECHPYLQQSELRALAGEHGHTLVAYSPLAKGAVLSDSTIRSIAVKHDATPAQVTLAWLREYLGVVPIPRSTSPAHIEENLASLELNLDADDHRRIDAIDRHRRQVDFAGAPWSDGSPTER